MSTAGDVLTAAAITATPAPTPVPAARRERWLARVSRIAGFLSIFGLGWVVPLLRIGIGEPLKPQLAELWRSFGIPVVAILLFLAAWGFFAPKVKTSLGVLPGPVQVWRQAENLLG